MDFASARARLQLPLAASRSHRPFSSAAGESDGASSPPEAADDVEEDYGRSQFAKNIGDLDRKDSSSSIDFQFKGKSLSQMNDYPITDLLRSVDSREQGLTMTSRMPGVNKTRRVHFSPREADHSSELTWSFGRGKYHANKITQTVAIAALLPSYVERSSPRVCDVAVNTMSETVVSQINDMYQSTVNHPIQLLRSVSRPPSSLDPQDSSSCSEDSLELERGSLIHSSRRVTSNPTQPNSDINIPQSLNPAVFRKLIVLQDEADNEISNSYDHLGHIRANEIWERPLSLQQNGQEQPFPSPQVLKPVDDDLHDDLCTRSLQSFPELLNNLTSSKLSTDRKERLPQLSETSAVKQVDHYSGAGVASESVADLSKDHCQGSESSDLRWFGQQGVLRAPHPNLPHDCTVNDFGTTVSSVPNAGTQKHLRGGSKALESSYWFDVPFSPDGSADCRPGLQSRAATRALRLQGLKNSNRSLRVRRRSYDGVQNEVKNSSRVNCSSSPDPRVSQVGRPRPDTVSSNKTVYPGTLCCTFVLSPGDIMMTRNLRTEENKVGGYVTLFPDPGYFETNGVEAANASRSGYYQFTLFDMVLRLGKFDIYENWNWIPDRLLSLYMYAPGEGGSASWWLVESIPSIGLPAPDHHHLDNEADYMPLNSRVQLAPRNTDLVISTIPEARLVCQKRWRAQWWTPFFLPLTQDVLVRPAYGSTGNSTVVTVELYSYCGDSVATWRFLGLDTFSYGGKFRTKQRTAL